MFVEIVPAFRRVQEHMDSEFASFQSGLIPQIPSAMPPRQPMAMPAGEIAPWTPARMAQAMSAWVMKETNLPAPLSASLALTSKRRA